MNINLLQFKIIWKRFCKLNFYSKISFIVLKTGFIFKDGRKDSDLFGNDEILTNPFTMKDSRLLTPKKKISNKKIKESSLCLETKTLAPKTKNKMKLRKRSDQEYLTVAKSLMECLSYLKGTEEIFDLIAENPFRKIVKNYDDLKG